MDRMVRVNELLKRELSQLVEREICRDFDCLVTVTAVETAPNLQHATVYVSVYGGSEQKRAVMARLHAARADFQHDIARSVTLKYTPVLHFQLDETGEEADHIMKILRELEMDE
jgi:ribosome-binding factor A